MSKWWWWWWGRIALYGRTPAPEFSPGHGLDHEVGSLPYHAGGRRLVPLTLRSFPNEQCHGYALLDLGNSPQEARWE